MIKPMALQKALVLTDISIDRLFIGKGRILFISSDSIEEAYGGGSGKEIKTNHREVYMDEKLVLRIAEGCYEELKKYTTYLN